VTAIHLPPSQDSVVVVDTAAVQDTIAAVFQQRAYRRTLQETTWDRLTSWFAGLLHDLGRALSRVPGIDIGARVLLAVLIIALLARAGYLVWAAYERRQTVEGRAPAHERSRGGRDPWLLAQSAAASGDYTAAAHALYAALLESVARRERVRLHPSKTAGDYARDLRARSSQLFGRFRDFARSYDAVVYGEGTCDRERYERLLTLAAPIVRPHG
jgi:hypothetical protein